MKKKVCMKTMMMFVSVMAAILVCNLSVNAFPGEIGASEAGQDSLIFQAQNYSESKLDPDVKQNDFAADQNSIGGTFASGDYLHYSGIDFGEGNYNTLLILISAQGAEADKRIEVRLDSADGRKLGELTTKSSGDNRVFKEHYVPIQVETGVHDIYFVFKQKTTLSIDWFTLSSYDGTETAKEKQERMQWWRDAHYGQFIHWGAYAQLGGVYNGRSTDYAEWSMSNLKISREDYERDAARPFNPTEFSAKKIVDLAKEAGQKYIIFTSRHHEGFSMYDTKIRGFQDYSLMSYGNYKGSDPMMALAKECENQDIKFGVYYTIMEWHDDSQSNYGDTMLPGRKEEYKTRLKGQLLELVKNYRVKVLWFDGEWVNWWTKEDGQEIYRYLRTLDPSIVVNNRVGKRHADDGDFGTPEQEIPPTGLDYDWESCMTLNGSWGYHKQDQNWKNAQTVISNLINTTSKGGNYLLNIGPDQLGNVPAGSEAILSEVGQWLAAYGESIYGTERTCFERLPSGIKATTDEGKVYLHLLNFPQDKNVRIPKLNNEILNIRLMATGQELSYSTLKNEYIIDLENITPDAYDTIIEIDVIGKPQALPENPKVNIALEAKEVIASDVHGNNLNFAGAKAADGVESTRWATNDGVKEASLELQFETPVTVNKARLLQYNDASTNYTNAFCIEYWKHDRWETAYTGGKVDAELTVNFDVVISDRIRFHITDASNPSYYEFQLFYEEPVEITLGDMEGQHLLVDQAPFFITGTAEGGSMVELSLGGNDFSSIKYSIPVQGDGTWIQEIKKLNTGVIHIKAALKDESGNTAAITQSLLTVRGSKNLAKGQTVSASSEYSELEGYDVSMAVDGNQSSRWSPEDWDRTSELTLSFQEKTTFNKVILSEMQDIWSVPNDYRCRKFRLSSYDGIAWNTIYEGGVIGEELSIEFQEIQAEKLKLSVLEVQDSSKGSVNIQELEIYNINKPADKTVLQQTMTEAQAKLNDGKNYTPDSLKVLKTALEQAQTTVDLEDVSQEEVDAANAVLISGLSQLKEQSKPDKAPPKEDPIAQKVQLPSPVISRITSSLQYVEVKFKTVQGANSYEVYRKIGSKKPVRVKTVTGTSFKDYHAKGGKKIIYYLKAIAGDLKRNTNSALGKGKSIQLPGATKITSIKRVKKNVIQISWKKVKGSTEYVILRSTNKNGTYSKVAALRQKGVRTYRDTRKLKTGKIYYYKVVSRKGNCYSPPSHYRSKKN